MDSFSSSYSQSGWNKPICSLFYEDHTHFKGIEPKANSGNDPLAEHIC